MARRSNINDEGLKILTEKSEVTKAVEKSYKKYANGFQRPSILLSLEPRMMFDGAAPTIVDEIIDASSDSSPESLPNPSTDSDAQSPAEGSPSDTETQETADAASLLVEQTQSNDLASDLDSSS